MQTSWTRSRGRSRPILLSIAALAAGCSESMGLGPSDPGGGADAASTPDSSVTADASAPIDASDDAASDDRGKGDEITVDSASIDSTSADAPNDALLEGGGTCASRCASGLCEANGDCKRCVKDDECLEGRVCGSGVCAPRCGASGAACAGSFVCCNEHCVDPTLDAKHCGACGVACTASQFCGNVSAPPVCKAGIVANVCNAKTSTFLLDGLQADQEASAAVQAAMAANCAPPPLAMTISQSVAPEINTTTGQPVAGAGDLLVAVGGDSAQRLVNYLEDSRTTLVYNEYDGFNTLWFKRRDGTVIATITMSTLSATHDYFLIEVVPDPVSGTFSLVLYGLDGPGTRAAAHFFANNMLPAIATYTQSWYLYEWIGTGAGGPTSGDTFTPLASGM